MRNDTRTYLSPEDRTKYQLALVGKLFTRNESLSLKLAEEWIQQRIKAGESVGCEGLRNPKGMQKQIVSEMQLLGWLSAKQLARGCRADE